MNFGCRFEPSKAETRDGVGHLRVGEAAGDEVVVVPQVHVRHRGHDRDDLLGFEPVQEAAHQRVRHRVVNEMDAEQPGRIGDGRVPSVEDADLHEFVGGDMRREGDAHILERRTPAREPILQNPLPERLAEHRPLSGNAEALGQDRTLPVRGRRGDAVDHAAREGHALAHISRERGIDQIGKARNRVHRDMPVAWDVVAGHHRERGLAPVPPPAERRQEHAEHALRGVEVLGIVTDLGMVRVERAGRGVDAVAALRHRQRHDPQRGIVEGIDDAASVLARPGRNPPSTR